MCWLSVRSGLEHLLWSLGCPLNLDWAQPAGSHFSWHSLDLSLSWQDHWGEHKLRASFPRACSHTSLPIVLRYVAGHLGGLKGFRLGCLGLKVTFKVRMASSWVSWWLVMNPGCVVQDSHASIVQDSHASIAHRQHRRVFVPSLSHSLALGKCLSPNTFHGCFSLS